MAAGMSVLLKGHSPTVRGSPRTSKHRSEQTPPLNLHFHKDEPAQQHYWEYDTSQFATWLARTHMAILFGIHYPFPREPSYYHIPLFFQKEATKMPQEEKIHLP
jgi:hypothetical protein